MKLLYVVNNPAFFLSHRLAIAKAARDEGYEVHVATPESEGFREVQRQGFIFHPIPLDRSGGRVWREVGTFAALWALYRRIRPHIVHHVTIKPVLYGSIAARLAGVPSVVNAVSGLGYVFLARGLKAALVRNAVMRIYRIAFSHPNLTVIFQNPDDQSLFANAGMLTEAKVLLIKGSGVDVGEYIPSAAGPGEPLVVLPARMLWDKGVREFVEAAVALKGKGVEARFALVGGADDGNPASADSQWLEAVQKGGSVEWWGHRQDGVVGASAGHARGFRGGPDRLPAFLP
jgi:glycosyltransferase involved in cell wall biosynthesis